MKKALIFLAVVLGIFTIWFYWKNPLTARVKIHNHIFLVDVAVTPKEKELGLGNRDSLAANHGMLFPYDHKDQYGFWMKGMRFPIDILWIADTIIVDITPNVPIVYTGTPPIYRPRVPVDKVLELSAGTAQRAGITIGDTMEVLR